MSTALLSYRPEEAPADASSVEVELASLEGLDLGELRLRWRNRFGRSAPANLPRHLLARLFAYRIQVGAHGGLSRESERLLDRMATDKADMSSRTVEMKPGTLLTREWQGRLEQVMATRDGFAWRDRMFPSLSAVASVMTGTRWNGRRFFGLVASKDGRGRVASAVRPAAGVVSAAVIDRTSINGPTPSASALDPARHDAPPLLLDAMAQGEGVAS